MILNDPVLKYPGAKWRLAPWIASHMPNRKRYVEPFFGSGGVFFNLPKPPKHAVLNDLDGEVVNFFRVLRTRPSDLAMAIELTPWAREEYELAYTTPDGSCEVEKARRFAVRCWHAFGTRLGTKTGWRSIGIGSASTTSLWNDLPRRLIAVADRLKSAEIENRPALDVIEQYNSEDVLLYVDPPYPLKTRTPQLYRHEMSDDDHSLLLSKLLEHKGAVVLSGYRCELYDDMLSKWQRIDQSTIAEHGLCRTESIWLNYQSGQQLSLI